MTKTSSAPKASTPGTTALKISAFTATAIAVADMVGIGVFTSLGFQVIDITSGFSILMLWAIGGIVVMAGALSYCELATAFPRAGGEYNYLSRVFHPAVGFLAGWISATVGFAAPVALAAMAFGKYFVGALPGEPVHVLGLDINWLTGLPHVVYGFAVVGIVTLVHLSGIRLSSTFHNVSTLIKVALIVGLIIAGLFFAEHQPISFMPSGLDFDQMTSVPFAVGLVYVLYSYSGWNAPTYIADEVRDPERNLPISMISALSIVIVLYMVLNAVFLLTTPIAAMKGQLDVARVAGEHILGPWGGPAVGGLICFGLIATISAMMWIGPRVTMAIGQDIAALGIFARKTSRGVPAVALLLQAGVTSVLLATQSFEAVLNFIQFSLILSSFVTVLGVIVLRIKRPDLPRPYRVWGYPITPFIFLAVTLYVLYFQIDQRPTESLAGFLTMMAGLVIYAIFQLLSRRSQTVEASTTGE